MDPAFFSVYGEVVRACRVRGRGGAARREHRRLRAEATAGVAGAKNEAGSLAPPSCRVIQIGFFVDVISFVLILKFSPGTGTCFPVFYDSKSYF